MSQKLHKITQNHCFFKKGLHNCYKYVNISMVIEMKVYLYDISLFFAVVSNIVISYGSDDFHIRCDCDAKISKKNFWQGIKI